MRIPRKKGEAEVGRDDAFADRPKRSAVAVAGALALTGAVLVFGAGTANADVVDIGGRSDPVFDANPAPKGGVRTSKKGVANAGSSDVRRSAQGTPMAPPGGEVKDSLRAVPSITGGIGTGIRTGPARNGPGMGSW